MEDAIDLDVAALEIERRTEGWRRAGLTASALTWRDQGAGWPPPLLTDRPVVRDPDSLGVALRKGDQEGQVVLFRADGAMSSSGADPTATERWKRRLASTTH